MPAVEGRVYEPFAADADTPKPYLIVREMAEDAGVSWAGYHARLEVWPYVEQSSLTEVDALQSKIVKALDKQRIGDAGTEVLTCMYGGTEEDIQDADWDALTRCVYFNVLALHPAGLAPVVNDAWVDALVAWTAAHISNAHTYGGMLPTDYKLPAILWRLDTTNMTDCGACMVDVNKTLVAHIIASNATEEANLAMQLSSAMRMAIKLPLNVSTKDYMTLQTVHLTLYVDALRQGQLRAELHRKIIRPLPTAELIGQVSTDGHIRGVIDNG